MTTQLCECDSRDCKEVVTATIELMMEIRKDPRNVFISKKCSTPKSDSDVLVDEGGDFYVYAEIEESIS
jgi:hypothetical protein